MGQGSPFEPLHSRRLLALIWSNLFDSGGGIFLGSQTISTYDVSACASLCNNLVVDAQVKAQLGACQSFNIWRSLVDKMPTTYTCQFYAAPITASGATYSGNAGLKLEVTMSRGYNRINSIVNGKLRNFNNWLVGTPRLGDTSSIYDIGRTVGHGDSGTYFSGFTKWFTTQETPGSLKTANRISTIPGRRYTLQLWYRQDTVSYVELAASISLFQALIPFA